MNPTHLSCHVGRQTRLTPPPVLVTDQSFLRSYKFPVAAASAASVDGAASHDVAAPLALWYRRVKRTLIGGVFVLIATYGLPYWWDGFCLVAACSFALAFVGWIAKEGGDL